MSLSGKNLEHWEGGFSHKKFLLEILINKCHPYGALTFSLFLSIIISPRWGYQ